MSTNLEAILKLGDVAAASANVAEAHKYYTQALELDPTCVQAWLGKGKSAGWSSTILNIRLLEMETCISEALKAAPTNDRPALWADGAASISQLCSTLWGLNVKHLNDFGAMVIPESFGLGILKKAKPVPGQAERFRGCTLTILQTLERTIDQGEKFDVPISSLYQSFFEIAKWYYATMAITLPDADAGYQQVGVEFPPEEKRYVHALVEHYLPRTQAIDPPIPDPRSEAKALQEAANKAASSCFIATAACGSPNHRDVRILRNYRDTVLMQSLTGRAFVHLYCRLSPPMAAAIAQRQLARTVCRFALIHPAASIASIALQKRRIGSSHEKA